MNEQDAMQLIKLALDEKRYAHSLRVRDTAEKLAIRYKAPIDKVILASLLHDFAKCQTQDRLKANIIAYQLPNELLQYHHELWHGPVAAKILSKDYLLADEAVIRAIYYHTTGCAEMGLVEVIVFVADYIEPARSMPGVNEVRRLANENIYDAARTALKNTMIYLMKNNAMIHPDSFMAYNEWTKKMQGGI